MYAPKHATLQAIAAANEEFQTQLEGLGSLISDTENTIESIEYSLESLAGEVRDIETSSTDLRGYLEEMTEIYNQLANN